VRQRLARFEPVIRSEVEQSWVEADRVALPLQHGTAQIVVQNDSWDPLPCSEGAEMAAQEVLHAGVEEEAQKDLPREAEYHDECHQGAPRPTNHQMAEVSPVALRLFTRQGAQTKIGLRLRTWPMAGNDSAEAAFAAAIGATAPHV
jgi:hypothetical protein